ncbi:hypothetical protein [Magnetovibrio sp.]|uniref:hypothetical protein n=1 Tax=Magnetovibrio sp. TaxID=2024836 RepID=UPI002F9549BD
MTKRKKALVFIDFDMLIRHFVSNETFAELEKSYEVLYVFHKGQKGQRQGINADVSKLGLKNFIEFEVTRTRMGEWDHFQTIAMVHNLRGTRNYQPRMELLRLFRSHKLVNLYWFLSLPFIYPLVRKFLTWKIGVHQGLQDLIDREAPDIVFHPTVLAGYFINDLLAICPRKKIPLVALMNSWDNPSGKAATVNTPDYLAVWGDQTRSHAIEFMKMPADRVLKFGSAQFQVYRNPVQESDDELRVMFGVPKDIPIVLYGGTSKSVIESEHLKLLDTLIESGKLPRCHILYRPHPWRGSLMDREESLYDMNLKHVTLDPHMKDYYDQVISKGFTGFYLADYSDTQKLMHLASAIISPLSTILLEGVMHGLPVLILRVDAFGDNEEARKLDDLVNRAAHFQDLRGPYVLRCDDNDKLPEQVDHLMNLIGKEEVTTAQLELARSFVEMEGPSYGERLKQLADKITGATTQ